MAAIRAARAAVNQFVAREWPRVRCPVCRRFTVAVRGILARHQAVDNQPLECPGSGGPLPPAPEAKGGARE